ncbi:MAG: hypothetical protein ACP5UF_08060 [Hydrogenobaculum sp.]
MFILLYKIRHILYSVIFIAIFLVAFNSVKKEKEKLYNEIAQYERISFLIKNGKPKTKTLNENYIRALFSNTKVDYIKYENGFYNIKASNVGVKTLANIVYQIENDGFKIVFLKAKDYTGEQNFDVLMEISP